MLRFSVIFLGAAALALAQDADERTCLVDGTHCSCRDEDEQCGYWQSLGECDKNVEWMKVNCPVSCGVCDPSEIDLGLPQSFHPSHQAEVDQVMEKAKAYVERVASDDFLRQALPVCKNRNESCAYWATLGECTNNPSYMQRNCAPVCESCDQVTIETRCPIDPDAPNAWAPGSLNEMFLKITTRPEYQQYSPKVLSRPTLAAGDNETNITYKLGPWLVVFDSFATDEESDRLIELGTTAGYERSADVGKKNFDGTFEPYVNDGRTSKNAWCQNDCYEDPIAKDIMHRIGNVTGIPEQNSEYLQLLRYDVGQYYKTHHDYIEHQSSRQVGGRLLTFYVYLNDVEAGGGTQFPVLDLTVTPKKGRAVLWSSVKDEDPNEKDERTTHQALPVVAGVKYGANAWIHQRDFKGPNQRGCSS